MEQQVKRPRTPRFSEYLTGALFGYAFSEISLFIIIYLLQICSIDPDSLNAASLYLLYLTPYFSSGAIAGYIVVRGSEIDHWKVGIKTGIGCAILIEVMTVLMGGSATILALITVFLGCVLIGYLYGITYQRKAKTQNK